jgi:hypothetical protein
LPSFPADFTISRFRSRERKSNRLSIVWSVLSTAPAAEKLAFTTFAPLSIAQTSAGYDRQPLVAGRL